MDLKKEAMNHLKNVVIPFWEALKDDEYGGFYGYMDYDLKLDKKAEKGCILNSRELWFFSQAYRILGDKELRECADHAYLFLKNNFYDREHGGVVWSLTYDGKYADTTKHTYCQAFAIYGLAAYYEITKDPEVLKLALDLYHTIEDKCRDEGGYLEAFNIDFSPVSNEKLSENGVEATRTMNTLLHVYEGYAELLRVSGSEEIKKNIREIIDIFTEKMFNPERHRLEVFFDHDYNSLIDLISYGHDIESAWLLDWGAEVLDDKDYIEKTRKMTSVLTKNIYDTAFDGHSLPQECERGVVNTDRVWWVQAEAVNGFLNGYEKENNEEYLKAAGAEFNYIMAYMIDSRKGSEWFWLLDKDNKPYETKPIVEPWKCPYHNGRMLFRILEDKNL